MIRLALLLAALSACGDSSGDTCGLCGALGDAGGDPVVDASPCHDGNGALDTGQNAISVALNAYDASGAPANARRPANRRRPHRGADLTGNQVVFGQGLPIEDPVAIVPPQAPTDAAVVAQVQARHRAGRREPRRAQPLMSGGAVTDRGLYRLGTGPDGLAGAIGVLP